MGKLATVRLTIGYRLPQNYIKLSLTDKTENKNSFKGENVPDIKIRRNVVASHHRPSPPIMM
jgi:hypothetical protein